MTPVANGEEHQHSDVYARLRESEDFVELQRSYFGFVLPWTIAFMVWYLLYVLACNYAPALMTIKVVGNINVALIFGLLQFVSTFGIAWLYSSHSNRKLDPRADRVRAEYEGAIK